MRVSGAVDGTIAPSADLYSSPMGASKLGKVAMDAMTAVRMSTWGAVM